MDPIMAYFVYTLLLIWVPMLVTRAALRHRHGLNAITGKPRLTLEQRSARTRARAEIAAAKSPRDLLPSGLRRIAIAGNGGLAQTEADKWREDALAALKPEDVRWLAATGWEPPRDILKARLKLSQSVGIRSTYTVESADGMTWEYEA